LGTATGFSLFGRLLGAKAWRIAATTPKAARIPIATTVTTVRESTKAPNKLPKFGPPSDELPQPRVQFLDRRLAIGAFSIYPR
jgi:hypothetical protein